MLPRRKTAEAITLLVLVVALLGCTQEAMQPIKRVDFSSELKSVEAVYSKVGLSGEETQAIDSKELFSAGKKNALLEKLSLLEQELNSSLAKAKALPDSSEKRELLDLLSLEFSRLSYYKSMVEFKDAALFKELALAIDSLDFNSLQENNCDALDSSGELQKRYTLAGYSAEELENQVKKFSSSYPVLSKQLSIESKKPLLQTAQLGEFVKTAELLSAACRALSDSSKALQGLEELSSQDSLCFGLREMGVHVNALSKATEKLDSFSKKASSTNALSAVSPSLSEKAKQLLSLSTEISDFYEQLQQECK